MKPYFVACLQTKLKTVGAYVLVDIQVAREPRYEQGTQPLSLLSQVRTELLTGDLRAMYLMWLIEVGGELANVEGTTREPPVPPGLATLTDAQKALADFLWVDCDLLAAAADGSAPLGDDGDAFLAWMKGISATEKDRWLLQAAKDPDVAIGNEMLRAFRMTKRKKKAPTPRTVDELMAIAETKRVARQAAEIQRKKQNRTAAEQKRQRELDALSANVDAAWTQLEALIEKSAHDEAITIATDLRDLAARDGATPVFTAKLEALRKRTRRTAFFTRWKIAKERTTNVADDE